MDILLKYICVNIPTSTKFPQDAWFRDYKTAIESICKWNSQNAEFWQYIPASIEKATKPDCIPYTK